MLDHANQTFICAVACVELVGYSQKPVSAQARLKTRLTDNLLEAIQYIPVDQRIVLDTVGGATAGFLGDPEDALFLTLSLHEAMQPIGTTAHDGPAEKTLRMGINIGPVKLIKDINGHRSIVGDGINVAERIMGAAGPGQVAVSRSYFNVLSALSGEYAEAFQHSGSHTDDDGRDHDIYIAGHYERPFVIARHRMNHRVLSAK